MPWRKYEARAKEGKYGKVYQIVPGVKVRKDHRDKWTVFIEKGGRRKNRTIGEGREGLVEAIKVAEAVAERKTTGLGRMKPVLAKKETRPTFVEYAERWYREG